MRRLVLYPLYVLSEIAIISTDLAELLGSAIGFCLIFPRLPLWAGVLLTAADVLIFLAFSDPSRGQGRPVRVFEYTIIGLVSILWVYSIFPAEFCCLGVWCLRLLCCLARESETTLA